jgi:hypothetical protein
VAPSPLRFAAIEDTQRNIVKGRVWKKAEEMACMRTFKVASEDTEKGVSQKRADFMNTVFTVFRKFGLENHPEYSVPGLWASRSAHPVFQRNKRLNVTNSTLALSKSIPKQCYVFVTGDSCVIVV